jgi:hypothetical protein
MKPAYIRVTILVVCLFLVPRVWAQQSETADQTASPAAPSVSTAAVPMLIEFAGTLLDRDNRPMAGPVGVTFALYAEQSGGATLWMETQNVHPDANGNYAVFLGAASKGGLPAEQFASGKARWLGIQVENKAEQPRIMLVSVPYALKAGDAATLGGLPPSAFLSGSANSSASSSAPVASNVAASVNTDTTKNGQSSTNAVRAVAPQVTCSSITGEGVANFFPAWSGPCTLAPSPMAEACTTQGCNVGIGTQTPQAGMDVEAPSTTTIGVLGVVTNPTNLTIGVFGHAVNSGGVTQGVYGVSESTVGVGVHGIGATAGQFDTPIGTGLILRGRGPAGDKFTVDGAGNVTLSGQLSLPATTNATTGVINLGSLPFIHSFGTDNTFLGHSSGNFTMTGTDNTAIGLRTLANNTTGNTNTASGVDALLFNTTGNNNTATGGAALQDNTTGIDNTAIGTFALEFSTTGFSNTASGVNALLHNSTGNFNTASGVAALVSNTTGSQNTASGMNALEHITTGGSNVGIGFNAGANATTGSNNIYLSNSGTAADANTMRLGAVQSSTFIAGISGVMTGGVGTTVLVDSNGQFGTISSSRRFKYDIDDMGEASNDLLQLRPVTFRYKQGQEDGSHPLQYGLIAEEVAKAYPELVQYSVTGEVNTVLYHELPALLLNEVQKQHAQIEAQRDELKAQAAQLAKLQSRLEELEARKPAE